MRGLMIMGAAAAAMLLGAGCSGRERVVAEPLDMVQAKLSMMPEQADAMDLAMQMMGTDFHMEPGAEQLVWHFTKDGADYCRFTVKLVAAGPSKTRVITRAEDATEAADATVAAGGRRPDYSYLCYVARIAGDESVAATLENRAANTKAIYDRIGVNVATNPASMMRATEAAMDEAAREMESFDPCEEDIGSQACLDWESLQAVKEEQRRNQPPPPPGSFKMN